MESNFIPSQKSTLKIKYKLTEKSVKEGLKQYNSFNKRSVLLSRILFIIICLYLIGFFFSDFYQMRYVMFMPLTECISSVMFGAIVLWQLLYVFTAVFMNNGRIKKMLKTAPHANETILLELGENGINAATPTGSQHYQWSEVSGITESKNGFAFIFSRSVIFIEAKYVSSQDAALLRQMLAVYIGNRIKFTGKAETLDEAEILPEFKMVPLTGQPMLKNHEKRARYKSFLRVNKAFRKSHATTLGRIHKIVTLILAAMLVPFLNLETADIILISLGIFFLFFYIFQRSKYKSEYQKSLLHPGRVSVYENAIYFETDINSVIVEYKHMTRFIDKQDYMIAITGSAAILIEKSNDFDFEGIKDYIRTHTNI